MFSWLVAGLQLHLVAMNPKLLLPILGFLSNIELPPEEDANDFVNWLNSECNQNPSNIFYTTGKGLNQTSCPNFRYSAQTASAEVEVCSGEGQLSRALWSCGMKGKAFDVSWLHGLPGLSS